MPILNEKLSRRSALVRGAAAVASLLIGSCSSSGHKGRGDGTTYALLIGTDNEEYFPQSNAKMEGLLREIHGENYGAWISAIKEHIDDRFFGNIAHVYATLIGAGVPANHAYVLFADGKADANGSLPHSCIVESLKSKIEPARVDILEARLTRLEQLVEEQDSLLVFITGHGQCGVHSYLDMPFPGERIYDNVLHDQLSRIGGQKLLIVDACYSGGFANPELFGERTAVITSSDKTHFSLGVKGAMFGQEVVRRLPTATIAEAFSGASGVQVSVPALPNALGYGMLEGEQPYSSRNPLMVSRPSSLLDGKFALGHR